MAEVGALAPPGTGGGRDDSARAAPRPRPLPRRRTVPNGRAVVGGLLVAASAVGLFAAYSGAVAGPRGAYVVTRHALAAGARLRPSDLRLARMDLSAALAARAFGDPAALVGATVVAPLGPGELVQASSVVAKRSGATDRELSFPVERARLAAGIKAGERVDVVGTYGSGADAFTVVVVRQVQVVSLERSHGSLGDSSAWVLTVATDDAAAVLGLAHASQLAKLTVVRSTGADALDGSLPAYRPEPGPAPSGGAGEGRAPASLPAGPSAGGAS